MKTPPLDPQSRRDFLKLSAGFGVAATLGGARLMAQNSPAGGPAPTTAKPIPLVRVGFVGVGANGTGTIGVMIQMLTDDLPQNASSLGSDAVRECSTDVPLTLLIHRFAPTLAP